MCSPDPVAASIFQHLFASIAEEMGIALERSAYSPNIKERRDHSCALFDARGNLVAQAAHMPVHLGAFPLLMAELAPRFAWQPGDVAICNDPYVGGTHLPDVSLVSPVFAPEGTGLAGFVASRAHHADIGGAYPGSMAPATEIYQEGVIIPPLLLARRGELDEGLLTLICRNVRTAEERRGDFAAQLAANHTGVGRFRALLERYGTSEALHRMAEARATGQLAMRSLLAEMPSGEFRFDDSLDDDGSGGGPVPIRVSAGKLGDGLRMDFSGSAGQRRGSINATLAVTHAAVYYCLLCLLDEDVPLNQGCFDPIEIAAPAGTVVNARAPAAVAAGNVETSQRIVDTVLGALAQVFPDRVAAASQGTMNNLSLGGWNDGRAWAYYETMGGGSGGAREAEGAAGIHCHMSNTRNTPVEALEYHYPLRVREYRVRDGSGGGGKHAGGCGLVREIELLEAASVALLADRRSSAPYGIGGGDPGAPGLDQVRLPGEDWQPMGAKSTRALPAGARLRLASPGGGGWGRADRTRRRVIP
jgi:N-methylhydantoinase B